MQTGQIQDIAQLLTTSRVIVSILILAAAWLSLRAFLVLSQFMARRFSRFRIFISSLYPIVRLLVWVSALAIIVIKVFRPPANTVLAVTASAGLAVGLGAQDLVRNVLAGMILLLERPFRVGDMIQVGADYGEVTNIGLRSVQIHTFDDSTVTIPNASVLNTAVSNSNSGAFHEMVVVPFRLPATVDVVRVKNLAREAATSSPYVYLKNPVNVLVEDEFDLAFLSVFKVKAYVLDVRYERLFASDVMERIKRAIVREGLLSAEQFERFLPSPARGASGGKPASGTLGAAP